MRPRRKQSVQAAQEKAGTAVKLPEGARESFRVLSQRSWTVHHGGCLYGATGGIEGKLTHCEAAGVRFWVREHIQGNHFLISGGERLRMKAGGVPKSFRMVLEVAGPQEHLPWLLELVRQIDEEDATRGKRKVPPRPTRTNPRFTMETAPYLL